jgi:hypothetical protein
MAIRKEFNIFVRPAIFYSKQIRSKKNNKEKNIDLCQRNRKMLIDFQGP